MKVSKQQTQYPERIQNFTPAEADAKKQWSDNHRMQKKIKWCREVWPYKVTILGASKKDLDSYIEISSQCCSKFLDVNDLTSKKTVNIYFQELSNAQEAQSKLLESN